MKDPLLKQLFIIFIFSLVPTSQASLFSSEDIIDIELEYDFKTFNDNKIKYQKLQSLSMPGKLSLSNKKVFSVSIQSRGAQRLHKCKFPPLRLYFNQSDHGQDFIEGAKHVKFVSHCDGDFSSSEDVLREYLIYKLYALVAKLSFRTRLANVRYLDPNTGESVIQKGFFIEHGKTLAKKNGLKYLNNTSLSQLEIKDKDIEKSDYFNIVVFNEFIGNGDYSYSIKDPGLALKNLKAFRSETGNIHLIPYDFDFSNFGNGAFDLIDDEYYEQYEWEGALKVFWKSLLVDCNKLCKASLQKLVDALPDFIKILRSNEVGLPEDKLNDLLFYTETFQRVILNITSSK